MLDWMPLPLQPDFSALPMIQLGIEIQPVAFIPPAAVIEDRVLLLIDLISEDLR